MLQLMMLLFVACPVIAVVAFSVCMAHFVRTRRMRREDPEQMDSEQYRKCRRAMVISGIVAGVCLILVLGVVGLFFVAIAFM